MPTLELAASPWQGRNPELNSIIPRIAPAPLLLYLVEAIQHESLFSRESIAYVG